MAKVNITNVEVLKNPADFLDPVKFRITFECYEALEDDLEWRLTYVSSAYNVNLDQVLDSILVGPVPQGKHQFVFEADAPSTSRIPVEDVVGVTVIIISCLYHEQQFIRVGYYVNVEYADEELKLTPPDSPVYDKLRRTIIGDSPRVTRFAIDWGDGMPVAPSGETGFLGAPSDPESSRDLFSARDQQPCQASGNMGDASAAAAATAAATTTTAEHPKSDKPLAEPPQLL